MIFLLIWRCPAAPTLLLPIELDVKEVFNSVVVLGFDTILSFMLFCNFTCVEFDEHRSVCLHLFQRNSEAEIVQE